MDLDKTVIAVSELEQTVAAVKETAPSLLSALIIALDTLTDLSGLAWGKAGEGAGQNLRILARKIRSSNRAEKDDGAL